MGSEAQTQIPRIELSQETERGSKEWNELCKRVREACEEYGCFEAIYDKISKQLRDEVFSITKELFELPLETKMKNTNPKAYHNYGSVTPFSLLYEGFGIEDASNYHSLKAFSELLISDSSFQDHFCNVFSTIAKPVDELHYTIRNLIRDSLGVSHNEDSTTQFKTLIRLSKYNPPDSPQDNNLGLYAHTDKLFCTLICEDHISGSLEIQAKEDGKWIQWNPSPNSFIFVVGDPLMAWSNGRLHAVKHRVVMKGEKDRYSLAAFLVPVEGTVIRAPKELIDENHPPMFKDFDFMEFLEFSFSSEAMAMDSANILSAFLGI